MTEQRKLSVKKRMDCETLLYGYKAFCRNVNKRRKAIQAIIRNAEPDSIIYPRSSSRSRAMVGESYSWHEVDDSTDLLNKRHTYF